MEWQPISKRSRGISFLSIPTRCTPISSHSSLRRGFIPLQSKPLLSTQKRYQTYQSNVRTIFAKREAFESAESPGDEEDSEMTVYKKNGRRRQYNGDGLPFDVSVTSPPPEYLGRFQLDPRTHNGDIVEHDGRQFVVNAVRMRYRYSQGRYQMVGKAIEVKSLARKSIESSLERALHDS